MASWREARALLTLLAEYNARFPHRSKASDGMLGDAAHASRDSDHNPWIKDGQVGVVSAIDLTRDSAAGIPDTAQWLVDRILTTRDRRVKYLIHNGRIWRSYDKPGIPAWTPARYTGPNPHVHHVHVSVNSDKSDYDSTRPWLVGESEDDMPSPKDWDDKDWAAFQKQMTKLLAAAVIDFGKGRKDNVLNVFADIARKLGV